MRTPARNAPACMRPATLLLKSKTPSQAVLRLRGRLNLYVAFDIARSGLGDYTHLGKQLTTTSGGYPLAIQGLPTRQPAGSFEELESYITGNHLSICTFCIHAQFCSVNNDAGQSLLGSRSPRKQNALRTMPIPEDFGLPLSIVPEVGYELYLPRFHPSFSWNGLAKQFGFYISDLQNRNLKKEPHPP